MSKHHVASWGAGFITGTFLFLLGPFLVLAEESSLAELSCVPENGVGSEQDFSQNKGESVTFHCLVTNSSKETRTGLLVGKQDFNGEARAVAESVAVDGGQSVSLTLSFPPAMVPGQYVYSFVVLGQESQELSMKSTLTGQIAGEEGARISLVTLGQPEYQWGDTVSLLVSLAGVAENTFLEKNLKVKVSMLASDETDCQELLGETVVTQPKQEFSLTLPGAVICTNALRVTLLGKGGDMLDQKVVALSLVTKESASMMNQLPSSRWLLWGGVVGGVILLLAVLFLRHRKNQ